jgi:hypothetical protein
MPGVARVQRSEYRLRLLTQLVEDANHDEWMQVWPGGGDFMQEYTIAFLDELNNLMANWAASPWKPGPAEVLVAEEAKWRTALAMGNLALPKPREG